MKLGHIIYTVKDLDRAVKEWRDRGFEVEYGRKKNPINALIYFSEGPYIELMQGSGMTPFAKKFMRLVGKGKFMDRFDYWDTCPQGWSCIALDRHGDISEQIKKLEDMDIHGTYMKNLKRVDTKGRVLQYSCYFTDDVRMPFLMQYFNIDPKPKNFVHPNGVSKIKTVWYTTSEKYAEAVEKLVTDDALRLNVEENGFRIDVEFDKELPL